MILLVILVDLSLLSLQTESIHHPQKSKLQLPWGEEEEAQTTSEWRREQTTHRAARAPPPPEPTAAAVTEKNSPTDRDR